MQDISDSNRCAKQNQINEWGLARAEQRVIFMAGQESFARECG